MTGPVGFPLPIEPKLAVPDAIDWLFNHLVDQTRRGEDVSDIALVLFLLTGQRGAAIRAAAESAVIEIGQSAHIDTRSAQ